MTRTIYDLPHPSPSDMLHHICAALDEAFPAGETEAFAKARAAVRKGIADATAERSEAKQ